MIFRSSEIRWFSKEQNGLWDLYEHLPERGEGAREVDRTDYYLRTDSVNSGIKIREGNHEIKIKSGRDEQLSYGVIEHWMKWSTPEKENILNTIDRELLDDWMGIKKIRYKKRYEILNEKLQPMKGEFVDEGCGVEFTEIVILSCEKKLFTVGFEAFSSTNHYRENLYITLKNLNLDYSMLETLDSISYPEMLYRVEQELM